MCGWERRLLSPEAIGSIMAQLCVGVSIMHLSGVAHLDLKPDNILVDLDGNSKMSRVYLCDLGTSKATPLVANALMIRECGCTSGYTAPEVTEAQRTGWEEAVDGVYVDIFQLGKFYTRFYMAGSTVMLPVLLNFCRRGMLIF